ncbi:hypothetical protein [Nocardia sp. CA-119907]|uniref:hypothetical protein n=1 Tax=Nocardia sp. CA-119907 TaxID=3239973 RepID=UPI003D9870D5
MSAFAKSEAPPRVRTAAVAVPGMPGRYAEATESMKCPLVQRYQYVVRAAQPILGVKQSAALKGRVRFRELSQVPDLDVDGSAGMSALVGSDLPQRHQGVRSAGADECGGGPELRQRHQDSMCARPVRMSALMASELPQRHQDAVRVGPAQMSGALGAATACRVPRQALAVGTGASAAEVFGMSGLVTPELPQRYRNGACAIWPVRGLRVVLGAMPDEVLNVRRSAALKVRPGGRVPGQALDAGAGASEGRGWG